MDSSVTVMSLLSTILNTALCWLLAAPVMRVRGPHVTPGYWRRPDLTEAAFDAVQTGRQSDELRAYPDAFDTSWLKMRILMRCIDGRSPRSSVSRARR